ncbi:DUF4349 domain-containing protein [bacterium]|nr:DUF4349 domain-containing protein [bacterium]
MRRVHLYRVLLGGMLILSLAALSLVFQACGGKGSSDMNAGQPSMTLDSGVDKKVGRPAGEISNSNYDAQYRTPTATEMADGTLSSSDAAAPASKAPDFGDITASPLLAGAGDELARLNAWLSPAAYAADNQVDEKYLIRSGEISLLVDDFEPARMKVSHLARQYGGTVTNADIAKSGDNMYSGFITLRVPNERFFEAFEALLAVGEVASQKLGSEDVSQDYVSSISRLKTLTVQEATLRKLLEESVEVQRKRGLGEGYRMLLDTEQRLSEVSNEIQRVEDQLTTLADRINRSTITVELSERAAVKKDDPFSWGLGATFESSKKELVLGLRGFAQWGIHFLVTCWLWLVPWSLFIFVAWRLYKRYLLPRLRSEPGPGAPQPPATAGGAAA